MDDLISRKAVLDWISTQKDEICQKRTSGTDESIPRETLITMQRDLGAFETAVKNLPIAYDIEKVIEELKEAGEYCWECGDNVSTDIAIEIVKQGGVRKDVDE